ncbi:MAG TPA: ABC transporter permease [Gemmatimonadaceae bacterium]
MNTWLRDFAFGIRTLRKNPAFAVTALVTLALGIGASTAIFSVVNAVLLKPLPYARADQLVIVTSDMRTRHVTDFPIAPGDLRDIRDRIKALSGVAGVTTFPIPLTGDESDPVQINGGLATTNLLSVLGMKVIAGRDFNDDDATPPPTPPPLAPGAAPAAPPPPVQLSAILSYQFWQRRYGGDPKIIGKIVTLGPNPTLIVGVADPKFELLFPARMGITRVPDLITASRISLDSASRINVIFRLIGRVAPGASVAAAQGQLDALGTDLRQAFPIKKTAGVYFRAEPMHENLVADVRPIVLSLMGAVVFVLLISCANVANLILVRTSRRERELAVRAALGGSRARLVRQMLAEALVLSVGGSLLGLVLADAGTRFLLNIGPASLPRVEDVQLDPLVLGFTIFAGLVAAAVFGIVPALRASRPDLIGVLRQSGRMSELGGGRTLRNGVVMAEVALAFVLLIGSGLMIRSFMTLANTQPGYDPHGLLTFSMQVSKRLPAERQAWVNAMHERLAAIPGVTGVTYVAPLPLDGTEANVRYGTESAVTDASAFQQANLHSVIPGYFGVMRTRILDGRDFTEADNIPAGHAILIDNLLAAKAFPGERAVGKRLFMRSRGNEPEWMDIIGVVAHERHQGLATDGREAVFMADGEFGYGAGSRWVLRTNGDPMQLAASARAAAAAVDPLVPVAELKPMMDFVDQARAPTRFALILIGIFAGIAVVLAGVGLYGVLSTVVRQRTAEIGVRMALGSSKQEIFRLVIGQGMRLSGAGIGAGLVAAFALTRVMRSMLVGVAPTDPLTFGAVALLFGAIAALACWIPAQRAAGLDPITALRDE